MGTAALVTAGTMAAVGAVGNVIAAESAATASENVARAQLAEAKKTRELATAAAKPSAEELSSINRLLETRSLALNESMQALEKQKELLAAVDPAIKAAGEQALKLIQGDEAAALAPIRNERDRQRKALESQLQERLGGGFRTSSAGIEALSRFDEQTDRALFDAQQSTLGGFLNIAASARPDLIGDVGRVSSIVGGLDQSVLTAQQNFKAREISAINATAPAILQNVAPEARGDILRSQSRQKMFGDILQAGTTIGTASILSSGGGSASGAVGGGETFGGIAGGLPKANPYG